MLLTPLYPAPILAHSIAGGPPDPGRVLPKNNLIFAPAAFAGRRPDIDPAHRPVFPGSPRKFLISSPLKFLFRQLVPPEVAADSSLDGKGNPEVPS